MNEADREKIWRIIFESEMMPHGTAQAELAKEAVNLADVSRDLEMQFMARKNYVSATCFSGQASEMIVTFTWLLNHLEGLPEAAEYELLWPYKWVTDNGLRFSEFAAEQVDFFFEDSKARFRKFGYSLRPLLAIESEYHLQRGEFEQARELLEECERQPRDSLSDCSACDPSKRAHIWFDIGERERAVQVFRKEMLDANESCAEEPMRAAAHASYHFATLGRWDEAHQAYRMSYPKLAKTKSLGVFSLYCMRSKILEGELETAFGIFDKFLPTLAETRDQEGRFDYFRAGYQLMERLSAGGKSTVKLKNASHLDGLEGDELSTDALAKALHRKAEEIGSAFDRRNRATRYADLLTSDEV